eukprot:CCRYP_012082-RB/>CCRYP_012082-RB protein AED:0.24 eAED:0.19 QI:0/-1/0/1/-1/0/1/0/177
MNLYLYLPPTSSHPKGIGTGLIFGQVLRYRRLSTHQCDADKKIREFYQRLLARGHSPNTLSPLFLKAERNAKAYLARSHEDHEALKKARAENPSNKVFLHLRYHPEDPPAQQIQSLWRDNVAYPVNEHPLPQMKNLDGGTMGFDGLTIAYSRPLNLRNLFSVRDVLGRGKDVSDYLG